MSILVESTVADFAEAKLPFDDCKLMLHLGMAPHLLRLRLRSASVNGLLRAAFGLGEVSRISGFFSQHLPLSGVR